MKHTKLLGNGLLLLTAFIWGTAFVAQRVGMETIEPASFNAARMTLAAAAVGIYAFITGRMEKKESCPVSEEKTKEYNRNTITGGIYCGFFLAIASMLQQMGIVYTTAGKAGFITAMYILLVPVIGFLVFKKKNTLIVWFAVLLGIVGMYLLCITEEFGISRGDTLVCLCALFFSFHILCCDHFARRGDPIRISVIQFTVAAFISAIAAVITENPDITGFRSAVIPIIYCGIMSGGIGYTLQLVGQKYTDPAVASLLMSMESVFAVLAGTILLHEHMSARELAGCIIMLSAVILVQIPLPEKKGQNRDFS